MDFLDKLRITLSSPLKGHCSDSRDFKTWTLPTTSIKLDNVRLLLYRDCERRGRKCLFDSAHVMKDSKTGKFTYIPVTNTGQVKDLCEWIFGCVPLSSTSTKRFHRLKGNLIWSRTFQVPLIVGDYKAACANLNGGSSSCLSSNGDLTSSGYVSSSGIDDSSYDQSSTDSSKNWPLHVLVPTPVYPEANKLAGMKMCHSLPSRFEVPANKIILGIAILVATGDEDEMDHRSVESGEWKQFGAYVTSISSEMELSADWFASVAKQSYLNPPTFVETLYNFSLQYRQMLIERLTNPLANIKIIPLSVKSLPASIGEFLTAYLINDLWWIKRHPVQKRCKIVIVANPKKLHEVKSVLTLLKLINQCACGKLVGSTVNVPPTGLLNNTGVEGCNQLTNSSNSNQVSPKASISVIKKCKESSQKDEIGLDVVTMNPEDFVRQTQHTKHLKRVSTNDSGISSTISSTASLKRSSTSGKFFVDLPSSAEYSGENSDMDERVCFHLGEESDAEQTFNALGLSEPNPDKLKARNVSGVSRSTANRISPDFVSDHRQDKSECDLPDKCDFSPPGNPVKVDLNLPTAKLKAFKFCSYCDSISIVERFNPLFQVQWLKCTNCSTNQSSFEQCNNSYVNVPFSDSHKFSSDNWIFYNLDKSIINYFNANSKQEHVLDNPPSTLVTNLLEHVQVLMDNCRESEIEQFVNIQLGFIRKLGEDFGQKLMKVTNFDINSMPYVGESDLGLLFAVAGCQFPELRERFFV